ncbi:MAG: hypothetical protein H0W81_06590 [Chloroflexi bacterium]|nr:hypothetical protein [Chloroflexota bacterium]
MARNSIQLPPDSTGKAALSFDFTEAGTPAPNSGVRHVQALVVCDSAGNVINTTSGALNVQSSDPVNTSTGPTAFTATQATQNTLVAGGTVQLAIPNGYMGCVFDLTGTPAGASAYSFDASVDGGTTWRSLIVNGRGNTLPQPFTTMTGNTYLFGVNQVEGSAYGYTHVRMRCTTFTAGDTLAVRIIATPKSGAVLPAVYTTVVGAAGAAAALIGGPVAVGGSDSTGSAQHLSLRTKGIAATYGLATQDLKDSNRQNIMWTVDRVAATSAAETLATVTESRNGAATSTFTSKTITSGARIRLTSIDLAVEAGGTTPVLGRVYVRLRVNTAGATTTSSPIQGVWGVQSGATAKTISTGYYDFPDGMEFVGNGTVTIGVTITAMDWVVTTVIPTVSLTIFSFEY